MNDTSSQFTPTPLLATQQFEIIDDFFPGLELVAAPTDDGTHKVVHIAVTYQIISINRETLIISNSHTTNFRMKTYILDILNKARRFSEGLDAKTILCNRSWLVFNDNNKKQVLIFQPDGTLLSSLNGLVKTGEWQYISANKSVVISFDSTSLMLHPYFYDNQIFSLQQDGMKNYLFLLDENKVSNYNQLEDLNNHVRRFLEDEKRKQIEAEQKRVIEEKRKKEEEEKRIQQENQKRIEKEIKQNEERIERLWNTRKNQLIGEFLSSDPDYQKEKKKMRICAIISCSITLLIWLLVAWLQGWNLYSPILKYFSFGYNSLPLEIYPRVIALLMSIMLFWILNIFDDKVKKYYDIASFQSYHKFLQENNIKAKAEIQSVTCNYNIKRGEANGMEISVWFNVYHMKNKKGKIQVWIYHENGKTVDYKNTKTGNIESLYISESITPNWWVTYWNGFNIYFDLSKFNVLQLKKGSYHYYFLVAIQDNEGNTISVSDRQYFTYYVNS